MFKPDPASASLPAACWSGCSTLSYSQEPCISSCCPASHHDDNEISLWILRKPKLNKFPLWCLFTPIKHWLKQMVFDSFWNIYTFLNLFFSNKYRRRHPEHGHCSYITVEEQMVSQEIEHHNLVIPTHRRHLPVR